MKYFQHPNVIYQIGFTHKLYIILRITKDKDLKVRWSFIQLVFCITNEMVKLIYKSFPGVRLT